MKIKKVFITFALIQLCATLAFSQTKKVSAKDLLSQGIAAEKKGDNIQALTFYLQSRTLDKKLPDVQNHIWNVLSIMATDVNSTEGKTDLSPIQLVKIRDKWDKLRQSATDFLISNQPTFEIRYTGSCDDVEFGKVDFQDNTIKVLVGVYPFLRQTNLEVNEENRKLIYELNSIYTNTKHSNEWGLRDFPFDYAQTENGENKLKKKEDIDFKICLKDGNKTINTKWGNAIIDCYFEIEYGTSNYMDYKISGGNVLDWNTRKLIFSEIPVEYTEKKLSIKIEKSDSTKISLLKAETNILSAYKAIEYIKNIQEGKTETIKIAGSGYKKVDYNDDYEEIEDLGNALRECKGKVYLDLSDMNGIEKIGGYIVEADSNDKYLYGDHKANYLETNQTPHAFENCESLIGIILPYGLLHMGDRVFYNCKNLVDVVLPDTVKTVGILEFENCTSLIDIFIPASIENFKQKWFSEDMGRWKKGTFAGSNFTEIYYQGSDIQWEKFEITKDIDWVLFSDGYYINGNNGRYTIKVDENKIQEPVAAKIYYKCNKKEAAELKKELSERQTAEKKAEEERIAAAKKAEEERLAAEETEREAEREAERKAAEKKAAEQEAKKHHRQKLQSYYDSGVVPAEDAADLLQAINFYYDKNPGKIKKIKIIGDVSNEMGKINNALSSQLKEIESQKEIKAQNHPAFKIAFFREKKLNLALDLSETEGLTILEQGQFKNLYFLAEVILPTSIVEIKKNAFHNCGFMTINYTGTKKQWKKIKIDKEGNEILLKTKINYEYKAK